MADKNGYRGARTGRGTEALTQRKADVEARKAAEHIYSNLNTFTLGGDEAASGENMSLMTNAIHIQESNQDALETANIINDALFRSDGGPIPGTSQVKYVALDDNARTVVPFGGTDGYPKPGEVWQLVSGSSIADQSPAQTTNYYLYYQCKDQTGTDQLVFAGSAASTSQEVTFEDLFEDKTTQYIDENCQVQIKVNAMGSATEYEVKFYAIRVR